MEENETPEVVKTVDPSQIGDIKIPKVININPQTREAIPPKEEKKTVEEPKAETPVTKEEPKKVETAAEVKTETKVEPETPKTEPLKEEPVIKDEPKTEPLFEITNASDAVKKLDEISMQKYGASYQESMAFKARVFEEEEDLDVMDTYYRMEDPDITDVELQAKNMKFRPLFMEKEELDKAVEDGKYTQEQIVALDAEFEGLKRKALKELNKVKANISFDEIKFSQKTEQPKAVETSQEQITAMKDAVTKFMTDSKQDKFVVKDREGKELATINVDMPEAQKVVEIAADPNSIYKLWLDEKGNLDVGKYARDIARAINMDKIVEVVYSNAFNAGKAQSIKEDANISMDPTGKQLNKTTTGLTPHDVVKGNLTY